MAAFTWGAAGEQMTPERIAAERKIAQALAERGMDTSPIQHWTQGVSRVAQALMGGYDYRRADEAERANVAADRDMIKSWFPGATPAVTPVAAPPVAPVGDRAMALDPAGQPVAGADGGIMPPAQPDYRNAIASIESAGQKNPYAALGPVTSKGDRAYGRYQVMGANIPQWTEQHLGRRMTPEQFLADPAAQDAVFDKRFGTYVAQTGNPQDAASMWFSGRPMAGNTSKDQLGTSVPTYVQKFTKALGPQVAQAAPAEDPAALPPTATPTQGYAIPGQPAAAPASPLGKINPSILAAVTSPYTSPGTKKIAQIMLQHQMQGESVTTVDLGNKIGIMDKRGNIIRQIEKSRDPMEIRGKELDIRTKEKGLDAAPTVQRVKQADGSELAVQWDPVRKDWVPLRAPEGGNAVGMPKLTEQQSKDVGFYNRGQKLLPRLEQQDEALTNFLSATGSKVPVAGNYLKSDAYRKAEQTGRELLAVILRKDTGAAVTPSEFELYNSIYLPSPADDAATVKQKRVARVTAIEGLRMGLGTAEIIFRSREAAEAAKKGGAETTPAAGSKTTSGVTWSIE